MAIPDYQTVMRPVLAWLADGEVRRTREVREAMVEAFDLTPEERAEMLPSGRQRVIDNRVGWAITYLAQAGLIHRPSRGRAQISDRGRAALKAHPDRIDSATLRDYPGFRDFVGRTREATATVTPVVDDGSTLLDLPAPMPAEAPGQDESSVLTESTPSDLVEQAIAQNRAAVEGDVLAAALSLSPTGFEDLVIALLSAMGYGKAGLAVRTSASGDAGIDGIISQDPLGLDRIYVQAKRYAQDRPVDLPLLQGFAGALLQQQGDRGVFITTSRFTDGARTAADRINARIELIDGARLAKLLVDYRVGVQPEQTVTLYRVDEDFFETL